MNRSPSKSDLLNWLFNSKTTKLHITSSRSEWHNMAGSGLLIFPTSSADTDFCFASCELNSLFCTVCTARERQTFIGHSQAAVQPLKLTLLLSLNQYSMCRIFYKTIVGPLSVQILWCYKAVWKLSWCSIENWGHMPKNINFILRTHKRLLSGWLFYSGAWWQVTATFNKQCAHRRDNVNSSLTISDAWKHKQKTNRQGEKKQTHTHIRLCNKLH